VASVCQGHGRTPPDGFALADRVAHDDSVVTATLLDVQGGAEFGVFLVPHAVVFDRKLAGLGERALTFGRGVAEVGVHCCRGTGFAVGEQGLAAGIEHAASTLEETLHRIFGFLEALGGDERVSHDEGGVLGVDPAEVFFGSVPALDFVAELAEEQVGSFGSACAAVVDCWERVFL